MARHRLGEREVARLVHLHREGYVLIPSEKEEEYASLSRKDLVDLTPARTHKTLKSQQTIVDIWRVELTPRGTSVAEVIERDSARAQREDVVNAETVALDMAALFASYDETQDYV